PAERSPLVARHAPLLTEALAQVGHPSTRNRGTVVGSLAHAEPAAEVPAVAVALDGVAVIAGQAGARRELAVADLLQGPHQLALEPGELIAELLLDPAAQGERQAWLEFAPRRFDLPLVGVAARVAPGREPRLTLAGVAPTPRSVIWPTSDVAQVTLLERLDELDPHRAHVARTLTRRALEACGR
ncbi:MAG TPA: FAD binding domain-containing protein, partial [Conexibacter sp.]|nr:FAD binding domain-containing protein [Conexibacter sp.]